MSRPHVHITMLSDYICPWCYVAEVRLQRIIQLLADEIDVTLHLRPALLYPEIPAGGIDKALFAKRSKPGMGRSLRHEAQVEDITIDYSQIERIPSSRAAHRLTILIQDSDQRKAVAMDIFRAYFSEGRDIECTDVLQEICDRHAVSVAVWSAYVAGYGDERLNHLLFANQEEHLNSVPTLILTDQILLPGLQPREVWESYIRRVGRMVV